MLLINKQKVEIHSLLWSTLYPNYCWLLSKYIAFKFDYTLLHVSHYAIKHYFSKRKKKCQTSIWCLSMNKNFAGWLDRSKLGDHSENSHVTTFEVWMKAWEIKTIKLIFWEIFSTCFWDKHLCTYLIDKGLSPKLGFVKPYFDSHKFTVGKLSKINRSKASSSNHFLEVICSRLYLLVGEYFCTVPIP